VSPGLSVGQGPERPGRIPAPGGHGPVDLKDLGELIVSHQGPVPVRIKDVATVNLEYAEIFHLNRINGQPTIMLRVLKEKGKNTLKVARQVKARLEQVKKNLPPDLIFRVVDDESQEILDNLRHLYLLAAIITLLIFLMIFIIIRRLSPSLLILSSVIFSAVITFNFIYLFKISLNMLTLGALALGFGMFVDNSIVVLKTFSGSGNPGWLRKKPPSRVPDRSSLRCWPPL